MPVPWKKSYGQPRQHIKKQRHYFADKGPSRGYGFSSSHGLMWDVLWILLVSVEDIAHKEGSVQFSSVQLSRVWLFTIPWTAARQASLPIANSQSLLKLISIESVMPSNHLILCHPLLLLPSHFPSIKVFSNESVLCIRWPKYWIFSFRISPSNDHSYLLTN